MYIYQHIALHTPCLCVDIEMSVDLLLLIPANYSQKQKIDRKFKHNCVVVV